MIQDNFSRSILSWQVAMECKTKYVLENLQNVNEQYLLPNAIDNCEVVSDDGCENSSINSFDTLHFKHIVAHLPVGRQEKILYKATL